MWNVRKLMLTIKYLTFVLLFTKSHYLDYFTTLERDLKIDMIDFEIKTFAANIP